MMGLQDTAGYPQRTRALLLSTMAMAASFVIWSMFSPLAGQLQAMFGLTAIQRSVLIAAPVLLGSIMRIPMGILTDRFGGRRVFTATMLFLLLPLGLALTADTYGVLLACAVLLGMAGSTFAVSMTYISRWYPPEKQGFVLGLAGLGNLGTAGASFGVPVLFERYGLDSVFITLAILITVVAVLFWFGPGDPPLQAQPKKSGVLLSVMKHRSTWVLSLFYFLTFGGFVAFSVYLPTFLKELFGLSAADAGLRTAGFVLVATLVRPYGGYAADRIGASRVLAIVFGGIMLAALMLALALQDFVYFTTGCMLAAVLFGLGNGAVFKMVPEMASGNTGAVTGIVGAAGGLGGFFPPILLGVIQGMTGTYMPGFFLLMLFGGVCLILNRAARRMSQARSTTAAG